MQSQVSFNRVCGHVAHGNPAEVFPALSFAARFRKICKNKTLRLLGIPPKLIFFVFQPGFVAFVAFVASVAFVAFVAFVGVWLFVALLCVTYLSIYLSFFLSF